jgi:hypothetical protein
VLAGASEAPLTLLEAALAVLARRLKPAEVAAAARGLANPISDPDADPLLAELRWDVASAEIAVLAALEGAARLSAIGAPPGFSCTLGAKKVSVAVQTRPALGSGFATLRERLGSQAGDTLQRALVLRGVGFPKSLAPGELDRLSEVASWTTAAFSVGELSFDWLSAEAADGSAPLVSALLPGFKREVELAAKNACADPERELPFLLAEVVLPDTSAPTSAVDLLSVRETVAKKTAAGAARLGYSAGFSWLGVLRVDWQSPEARRTLFVRPAANWPLSYRDLGVELGASVVVL